MEHGAYRIPHGLADGDNNARKERAEQQHRAGQPSSGGAALPLVAHHYLDPVLGRRRHGRCLGRPSRRRRRIGRNDQGGPSRPGSLFVNVLAITMSQKRTNVIIIIIIIMYRCIQVVVKKKERKYINVLDAQSLFCHPECEGETFSKVTKKTQTVFIFFTFAAFLSTVLSLPFLIL